MIIVCKGDIIAIKNILMLVTPKSNPEKKEKSNGNII